MKRDRHWAGALALALVVASFGCGSDAETRPEASNDDGGAGNGNGGTNNTGAADAGNDGADSNNSDGNGNGSGEDNDGNAANGNTGGEPTCSQAADAVATWTIVDPKLDGLGTPDQNAEGGKSVGPTGIAYGDGVWVAVARSMGEDVIRWARSEDAVSWTEHSQKITGTTYTNSRVHFVQGKFLFFGEHTYNGGAVSYAYVSNDGKEWTANKMSDSRLVLDEFDSSGELTILAGHDMDMRHSSDLKTWTGGGIGPGTYSYNDIAYGNGLWLTSINGAGNLYSSPDGKIWTAVAGLTRGGRGYYMEYGNGVWILFGGGIWKLSSDGVNFTDTMATGPSGPPRFTGGRFVTWRTDYTDKNYPDRLSVSSSLDGAVWHSMGETMLELPDGAEGLNVTMPDAAFGQCKLVIAMAVNAGGGGKSPVKTAFAVGKLAP